MTSLGMLGTDAETSGDKLLSPSNEPLTDTNDRPTGIGQSGQRLFSFVMFLVPGEPRMDLSQ